MKQCTQFIVLYYMLIYNHSRLERMFGNKHSQGHSNELYYYIIIIVNDFTLRVYTMYIHVHIKIRTKIP